MERAKALFRAIGERAAIFNSQSTGNFGDLFGALQTALLTECIMAAARIFDPPNKRYPTRSMRYVLELIKEQKEQLPVVQEPHQLGLTLEAGGMADLKPLIEKGGAAFAEGLADYFLAIISEPNNVAALESLKTLRDKSLAHNEHVETVEGPTWRALTELIDIAKKLVGILGWAYLGTAYEIDGDFILSGDALRSSYALERLSEKLQESPGVSVASQIVAPDT